MPYPISRSICALLMGITSLPASAIVNLDALHYQGKQEGLSGTLNAAFSGSSGNTSKSRSRLEASLRRATGHAVDYLLLNYQYGQSFGRTDTDKAFLHLRHIQGISRGTDWEVYTQGEQNRFARLSFRGLLGAGLRLGLYKRDPNALYLGAGGFYSEETLERRSGTDDAKREIQWRVNSYLLLRYGINDSVRFSNTLYYQPRIDDSRDYRLLNQARLTVELSRHLAITLTLDYSHDSRPPADVRPTDFSYLTGLNLKF